jgi:hypothetical protein
MKAFSRGVHSAASRPEAEWLKSVDLEIIGAEARRLELAMTSGAMQAVRGWNPNGRLKRLSLSGALAPFVDRKDVPHGFIPQICGSRVRQPVPCFAG